MMRSAIRFTPFRAELAGDFAGINRQWIREMFELETSDVELLDHPERNIIDAGGKIWFAEHGELGVVGTCALMKVGAGVFELTKMGVLESARGLKVGERLLVYVLEQAREMGVETLYLLSSAKCEAAIHLYLKHGFVHDKAIMARYGASYERCDVAMRWMG
jgi:N-acetylglutamate synthase-like GNAT family acetyltransferase